MLHQISDLHCYSRKTPRFLPARPPHIYNPKSVSMMHPQEKYSPSTRQKLNLLHFGDICNTITIKTRKTQIPIMQKTQILE